MIPLKHFALPALLALPTFASAQDAAPVWDFYGQLNLGVINVDNGENSESGFTDNDNSNSRVGAILRQDLDNGGQFRFHFESALGFVGSSSINGEDDSFDENFRRTDIRKLELIFQTARIGTFFFGQGSIATDGSAEADLSGTSVIAYSSLQDQAGSQVFLLPDGSASGTDVGDAFSAFDGGRRFRVRYDTPEVNGFVLGISGGQEVLSRGNNDEFYDIGVTYNKDYGDYKVIGRLGHSIRDSDEAFTLGSGAILHEPTGLSFQAAAGRARESDASYVYLKAGLQRDWFAFGRTHLTVDYYSGEDFSTLGSSSDSVGIAVVQKIDAIGLEAFASYRTLDFSSNAVNAQDIDVTFVGARWRF